jgi:PhnB protein
MKIISYLHFNGTCEAAFKFYEKVLGGKLVQLRNHAEAPMADKMPKEWLPKIMHAQLELGDQALMGSDAPPDYYRRPSGFSVSLAVEDEFESERIFHALAHDGTVTMPLAPTFWAARFGMVIDQFGIPWMVSGGSL